MTWKHNKKEFETHWIEKERRKERKNEMILIYLEGKRLGGKPKRI